MATQHDDQDDLDVAQNGGLASHDGIEDDDMEGEEGDLDDDMMDKISSSPSIDDGGSPCQLSTPTFNSPEQHMSRRSNPTSTCFSEARSFSPYLDLPDYLPVQLPLKQADKVSAASSPRHHHLPGAWPDEVDHDKSDERISDNKVIRDEGNNAGQIGTTPSSEGLHGRGHNELLRGEGTEATEASHAEGDMLWQDCREKQSDIDEAIGMEDETDDIQDLIVPYEGSTDEDDDDDDLFFESKDPRFVDSGWGGECLHDAEDIDFELVYALHTFIATVEGQANATKGDAMVLLDDSNSYWWLVRVVKDSSIGT